MVLSGDVDPLDYKKLKQPKHLEYYSALLPLLVRLETGNPKLEAAISGR